MPLANRYVQFVSDDHFLACVRRVCEAYPKASKRVDLEKLQRNTIDPFKMVFDILNSNSNVDDWVNGEAIRQNDKTLNNRIGEFHQKLLGGVEGWADLGTGDESKVDLKKIDNSIFIELNNKFNTVNSDSLDKVRDKLEEAIGKYPKAKGYWAYILDKKGASYDVVWEYKGKTDPRIRKISGKKVYELVTGNPKALETVWLALPKSISDILGVDIKITDSDKTKLVDFFRVSVQ